MSVMQTIKDQINNNDVILYMKGTPQFPQCGFSSQVSQILQHLRVQFEHVNILENPDIRAELPKYANWPTFPQLYVKQKLIGGADIVKDLFESGDLRKILDKIS